MFVFSLAMSSPLLVLIHHSSFLTTYQYFNFSHIHRDDIDENQLPAVESPDDRKKKKEGKHDLYASALGFGMVTITPHPLKKSEEETDAEKEEDDDDLIELKTTGGVLIDLNGFENEVRRCFLFFSFFFL